MNKMLRKKLTRGGFTLAELLIVIAIIAILVAIVIPIFTNQLDKAKVARDQANIRAGKSAAIAIILSDDTIDLAAATNGWDATITWTKSDEGGTDISNVVVTTATKAGGEPSNNDPGHVDYSQNTVINIKGIDLSKTLG